MKIKTYKNKYGTLELKPIGNFVPFSDFELFYHNYKQKVYISLDIAEKIALITENKDIQIGITKNFNAYVIVYNSLNWLSLAKVEKLDFVSDINPAQELEKLAKYERLYSVNV